MAWEVQGASSNRTYTTSTNVTTVTYSADQYGVLTYSSGGIRQYEVVVLDTATGKPGDIKVASTAAGTLPLGVLQDFPALGPNTAANVQVSGVSKVRAASAITVGDLVYVSDTAGRVGTAPAAGVSQSYIVGRALTAATQADD
ncbi:MAG TPA: capsid cement protein, partial [Ktedonobacterales bacterium]|nr:capsid cement protein [Ktedonobacterales bacterium]